MHQIIRAYVISRGITTLPGEYVDGDTYVVGIGTGDLEDHNYEIVRRSDALNDGAGGWEFFIPASNWLIEDQSDGKVYKFNGSVWVIDDSTNIFGQPLFPNSSVTFNNVTANQWMDTYGGDGGGYFVEDPITNGYTQLTHTLLDKGVRGGYWYAPTALGMFTDDIYFYIGAYGDHRADFFGLSTLNFDDTDLFHLKEVQAFNVHAKKMGIDQDYQAIVSGAIDCTDGNNFVITSSGNLTDINNLDEGSICIISAQDSQTVTVISGSGATTPHLDGGVDYVLDNEFKTLMLQNRDGNIVEISRSENV